MLELNCENGRHDPRVISSIRYPFTFTPHAKISAEISLRPKCAEDKGVSSRVS
jgi:hypothetical protein